MKTEKLFNELENKNRENYGIFIDSLNNHDLKIPSVTIQTELSKELMNEFELNDDIKFYCYISPDGGEMSYYYKNTKVDPDCYYVRPNNYNPVSTLTILQECIKQNTNKPDIKYLEV